MAADSLFSVQFNFLGKTEKKSRKSQDFLFFSRLFFDKLKWREKEKNLLFCAKKRRFGAFLCRA